MRTPRERRAAARRREEVEVVDDDQQDAEQEIASEPPGARHVAGDDRASARRQSRRRCAAAAPPRARRCRCPARCGASSAARRRSAPSCAATARRTSTAWRWTWGRRRGRCSCDRRRRPRRRWRGALAREQRRLALRGAARGLDVRQADLALADVAVVRHPPRRRRRLVPASVTVAARCSGVPLAVRPPRVPVVGEEQVVVAGAPAVRQVGLHRPRAERSRGVRRAQAAPRLQRRLREEGRTTTLAASQRRVRFRCASSGNGPGSAEFCVHRHVPVGHAARQPHPPHLRRAVQPSGTAASRRRRQRRRQRQ